VVVARLGWQIFPLERRVIAESSPSHSTAVKA